jgi:UDP-glucose 4-epimerase
MMPQPKSPYALQKLVGEYYCNIFAKVYGLDARGAAVLQRVRPAAGSVEPVSGVLSLFMKHVSGADRTDDFRDGEQSRDFTYVEMWRN